MEKTKLIEIVEREARRLEIEVEGVLVELGRKNATNYWGKTIMERTANGINAKKLRFAPRLLEEKEEFVVGVVQHELMHIYVNLKYGEFCGHDKRFKHECLRMGVEMANSTTPSKTTINKEKIKAGSKVIVDKLGEVVVVRVNRVTVTGENNNGRYRIPFGLIKALC